MSDYAYSLVETAELENMVFDLDCINEGAVFDAVEKCLDRFYNLSHYKLTREDLANTAKVKAAIKDMNLESKRNSKKRALPALIISIITFITSDMLAGAWLRHSWDAADKAFNSKTAAGHAEFERKGAQSEEEFSKFGGGDAFFKDSNDRAKAKAEERRRNAEDSDRAAADYADQAAAAAKTAGKFGKAAFVTLGIAVAALTVGIVGSISDYDRMIKACDHSVKKLKKELDKETDKKRIKELEETIKKINETQNMLIKKKKDEYAFTIRKSSDK